MINNAKIKQIVSAEMSDFLSPLGYKSIKVKAGVVASFEKNDATNYCEFHCHVNKYNDFQLVYGFSFGINEVVQVLKYIDSHVPLANYKYEVKEAITGISPGLLLDPLHISRAYKFFNTGMELLSIIEEIKLFYEKRFIPFCNKYSSLVELDKLMNSADDFWLDSTGKSIPISFFHVTRLVISKMSNSPRYDEVVERNFQALEAIWKAEGATYDRTDESKPEVFTANYLNSAYSEKE